MSSPLEQCTVMLQPVSPKSVPPDQLEQLYLVPPDHLEHYSLSPPDKLRCHRRSPSAISGPPTSCTIDSIIDLKLRRPIGLAIKCSTVRTLLLFDLKLPLSARLSVHDLTTRVSQVFTQDRDTLIEQSVNVNCMSLASQSYNFV